MPYTGTEEEKSRESKKGKGSSSRRSGGKKRTRGGVFKGRFEGVSPNSEIYQEVTILEPSNNSSDRVQLLQESRPQIDDLLANGFLTPKKTHLVTSITSEETSTFKTPGGGRYKVTFYSVFKEPITQDLLREFNERTTLLNAQDLMKVDYCYEDRELIHKSISHVINKKSLGASGKRESATNIFGSTAREYAVACGFPDTYYDMGHLRARCLGGKDIPENLVVMTAYCNTEMIIAEMIIYQLASKFNKKVNLDINMSTFADTYVLNQLEYVVSWENQKIEFKFDGLQLHKPKIESYKQYFQLLENMSRDLYSCRAKRTLDFSGEALKENVELQNFNTLKI